MSDGRKRTSTTIFSSVCCIRPIGHRRIPSSTRLRSGSLARLATPAAPRLSDQPDPPKQRPQQSDTAVTMTDRSEAPPASKKQTRIRVRRKFLGPWMPRDNKLDFSFFLFPHPFSPPLPFPFPGDEGVVNFNVGPHATPVSGGSCVMRPRNPNTAVPRLTGTIDFLVPPQPCMWVPHRLDLSRSRRLSSRFVAELWILCTPRDSNGAAASSVGTPARDWHFLLPYSFVGGDGEVPGSARSSPSLLYVSSLCFSGYPMSAFDALWSPWFGEAELVGHCRFLPIVGRYADRVRGRGLTFNGFLWYSHGVVDCGCRRRRDMGRMMEARRKLGRVACIPDD